MSTNTPLLTHQEMSARGGRARAKALSAKRRRAIARIAARARWGAKTPKKHAA